VQGGEALGYSRSGCCVCRDGRHWVTTGVGVVCAGRGGFGLQQEWVLCVQGWEALGYSRSGCCVCTDWLADKCTDRMTD